MLYCVSRSWTLRAASKITAPSESVRGFSTTSNSSWISPTNCSNRSSIVTKPRILPNSSTTMAMPTWRERNSARSSLAGLVSGTIRISRRTRRRSKGGGGGNCSSSRRSRSRRTHSMSLTCTKPRMWSRVSRYTGMRDRCVVANMLITSSSEASMGNVCISGRETIISRA